jgi:tripartite-type tricarboxylate transporter receptor subunit TctC
LVVVNPSVPAHSLPELIALDKASPGKLSVGVDSPRSLAGVTAQAINRQAGTSMVLVPYPNITGAIQDVMSGRIQVAVLSISIAESLVREGKIRALATASAKRTGTLPDVPTVAETLPSFDFSGWFMLMAPAGTPLEIIKKLNNVTQQAVKDEKVKEMAAKLGFEIDVESPEKAQAFLKEQMVLWGRITRELGLEPF